MYLGDCAQLYMCRWMCMYLCACVCVCMIKMTFHNRVYSLCQMSTNVTASIVAMPMHYATTYRAASPVHARLGIVEMEA